MFKIEAHGELSYIRNREHLQDVLGPSCSRPSGPGRWGNANFAITITDFSETQVATLSSEPCACRPDTPLRRCVPDNVPRARLARAGCSNQQQRQEMDGPQSVPKNGYPSVDHRQREVAGVATVAERLVLEEAGYGLVEG